MCRLFFLTLATPAFIAAAFIPHHLITRRFQHDFQLQASQILKLYEKKTSSALIRPTSGTRVMMSAYNDNTNEMFVSSRASFISTLVQTSSMAALFAPHVMASDETPPDETESPTEKSNISSNPTSLAACPPSSKACVSTASIKQVELYSPPWTYECTSQEAFARLKGVVASDPKLNILTLDEDSKYMQLEVERNALVKDVAEILFRPDENVVTFRSSEKVDGEGPPDFGANRAKMDEIRKKAAVFDVMGMGLTADSYDIPGQKRNGPLGQLKAFYGLQSGQGFESIFDE